jgi:xanthine dehydrogenase accessory factor
LDFNVTVMDDRPALANFTFFPQGTQFVTGDWPEIFAQPFPSVPTFGLIVTRGHRHDALVLERWIHQPFQFLGMIGSARKARTIFEHFAKDNLASREQISKVACPVGIKIGAVSVPEIAVSILAQYIEKRRELVEDTDAQTVQLAG